MWMGMLDESASVPELLTPRQVSILISSYLHQASDQLLSA